MKSQLCSHRPYGHRGKGFSPDFFDILAAYTWPGNIGELLNTLDRCLAAARYEPTLFSKHLPPKIRIQVTRQSLSDPHQQIEENSVDTHIKNLPPLQDFRDAIYTQAERQYLVDLMDLTAGDIKEAIPEIPPNYSCLAVNFPARQENSATIR